MSEARVTVAGRDDPLRVRINGPDQTFQLHTKEIRARAVAEIAPALEDFLEVACTIFAADSSIARGSDKRTRMGEKWRRRCDFGIPVRDPERWSDPEVQAALVELVHFLTEDDVSFRFTQREKEPGAQGFLNLDPSAARFDADEVILFSGGLDSFAGALETLAASTRKVLLVSHRSAQKVMPRQDRLAEYLSNRFPGRVQHIRVSAKRAGNQASETTQRSRTLLFAAIGQAVARTFGARRLRFYENGIISHNLPISPQVVGSLATRTTHPLTLTLLNRLMQLVMVEPPAALNPYQWLTKTDVLRKIDTHDGCEMISQAVSCTTIREQTRLYTHCGACSQCIDRRFAVLAADLAEYDPAEAYKTDVLFGPREKPKSCTMAAEWTRHALHLGGLDDARFFATFGLELSRIMRGHPDKSQDEVFRLTQAMHRRHSDAVREVLEEQVREHTGSIVQQKIPPNSLVRLHLGPRAKFEGDLASDPRAKRDRSLPLGDVAEEDLVPRPDAPLAAAFFEEDGTKVVAALGLGRVEGRPASIGHALKPAFDEDRSKGLAPDDHRFVDPLQLPDLSNLSKDSIRSNVRRCRDKLKEFHVDLHGVAPTRDLLIQSRQAEGYRLEPELRLMSKDRIEQGS